MEIDIQEISELEIPKYSQVFACVYDLFKDYTGVFFKILLNGKEKILQRKENLFVIYTIDNPNLTSYEMFGVDEEYKVDFAGFENFTMHTISGDRVIKENGSNNLDTLIFIKRSDGGDADGYDGSVGYIQYNQEKDVRLMLLYQQMYNSNGKVYSYHVAKNPFQIIIERGLVAKQKGSILPVRTTQYIRCDFDYRDHNTLYNLAVLKDYGLQEFLEKGAFALHKENVISRYQKIITKNSQGMAITGFPFCSQYHYEDFFEMFNEYGFKSSVPEHLLAIHNDEYSELNDYQSIANFMKEIEKNPPEEVIQLNLRFGGNDENGTDS